MPTTTGSRADADPCATACTHAAEELIVNVIESWGLKHERAFELTSTFARQ